MNIHVDSYFTIGHSHDVCQDYAAHASWGDRHVFMVADGCSSAPDTDFGSRLLCKAALNSIRMMTCFPESIDQKFHDDFRNMCIFPAYVQLKSLGMELNSLMSTLLVGISDGKMIHMLMYGDGYTLVKSKTGFCIGRMMFPNSSPFYPAYCINSNERNRYMSIVGGRDNNQTEYTLWSPIESMTWNNKLDDPLFTSYHVADLEYVMVATDGFGSFMNMEKGEQIDDFNLMHTQLTLKNHAGAFIKRRMKAFKRSLVGTSIRHDDDIGVAGIYFDHSK